MSKTSKKEHDYDMSNLTAHIEHILSEAWECRTVPLAQCEEFKEAQKLKRFAQIITGCVEHSNFGEGFAKDFPELSVQRTSLASAKTLHNFRQAAKAIVGPLKLAREMREYKDGFDYYTFNTIELTEYEKVLLELESVNAELKEVRRVNNEILDLFNPSQKLEGADLLAAIEKFKNDQQCTDTEACKPFGVSRTTLFRLRKEFKND
jgi:hypothetical protein